MLLFCRKLLVNFTFLRNSRALVAGTDGLTSFYLTACNTYETDETNDKSDFVVVTEYYYVTASTVRTEIDRRWSLEAERLRNEFKIQCVNVEDGLQMMRIVGSNVGFVSLPPRHVQKVVFIDQFLELILHISHFIPGKLKLSELYPDLLQILQKTYLFRP